MQPISWKKITVTLAYLVISVLLTIGQTAVCKTSPEAGSATIALLIVGGIVSIVFIVTQGKIDLSKLTAPGTPGANIEAIIVKTITGMLDPGMKNIAGSLPEPPAPSQVINLQATLQADGTYRLPDGTTYLPPSPPLVS